MKTSLRILSTLSALLLFTACGVGVSEEIEEVVSEDALIDAESELANRNGRFETFKGEDGKYYFHLLAANGQKMLASQGYSTLSGAKSGIKTVKTNGVLTSRFDFRVAVDGSEYFVLKAGNGSVIGVSEMYTTSTNAGRAAQAVKQIIEATAATPEAATTGARFESFRGLDSKYYFHARAQNGEIVLQSQGYTSSSGAKSGQTSVRVNGSNPEMYEVRPAADGQFFFVLKAGNGRVIARGETFSSEAAAKRAIDTVVGLLSDGEIR